MGVCHSAQMSDQDQFDDDNDVSMPLPSASAVASPPSPASTEPLEFRQWKRKAMEQKLLLRWTEAQQFPVGIPQRLVPIGLMSFMLNAYQNSTKINTGVVYSPPSFFQRYVFNFTPDGTYPTMTMQNWDTKQPYEEKGIGGTSDNERTILNEIHRGSEEWACSGGGDGFTHFLAYEKLSQMPNVYWGPDVVDPVACSTCAANGFGSLACLGGLGHPVAAVVDHPAGVCVWHM